MRAAANRHRVVASGVSGVIVGSLTGLVLSTGPLIAPIACVQNMYNLAHRHNDALVDQLAADGIAYVPFFPLGCFTPLQSQALSTVAARPGSTPLTIALSWLLQRSRDRGMGTGVTQVP